MRPDRAALAAAVAFVLLLLVAGGVLREIARGGPDVPPGPRPLPVVLKPGTRVEQTFFMPPREFSRVTVRLARAGPVDGRLQITLERLAGTDASQPEPVHKTTIDLRPLRGDVVAAAFAPVPRAWDQYFRIRIELAEGSREEVALLANARSGYQRGVLRIDGREQWGDLVFSAGSSTSSLLASLALLQGGIPAPLRSGVTVVALLVLFAAAASSAVWITVRPSTLRQAQGRPEQRRGARTSGRTARHAALVLALYFAGAGLWLLVTPPFEAPDEASHYDFVRYIAVNGSLPRDLQQDRSVWYDTEWFQPPLYYLVMSPVAAALDARTAVPLHERNPRSRMYGGREGTNYAHPEPPPAPYVRLLFALRLAGLAFGALTVWLLFRLVEHVSGDARAATLATTGLLLVPQFTAMSAVINNDGLATLLAAAAAFLIFTVQCKPSATGTGEATGTVALLRTILIGLVTGLAIATKLTTAFLVPMMAAALLICFRRRLGRLVAHGALFLASLSLTCGWVFVRNWLVFGDPLAREFTLRIAAPLQLPKHRALTDPFFLEQLPEYLYRSFWASFGWMSVEPPRDSWIWTLYLSLTIALIAALIVFVIRLAAGRVTGVTRRAAAIALCGLVPNLAAFLWYAGVWSANQARYFYPTLGPALLVMTPAIGSAGRVLRRLHPNLDRVLYALLYGALAISWLVAFTAAILRFHYGDW